MNIQERILILMETDRDFNAVNSRNIMRAYNVLKGLEREAVDNIFINLCGLGLGTIIEQVIRHENEGFNE
jgi:hypothetical protein